MIELISVSKSFGPQLALGPTNLTIETGELFVLVGSSGSGKSTLLRLIAGLETPNSGRLLIAGRDVTDRPPHERNVALVSQRPVLTPEQNVQTNLEQGLRFSQSRLTRRERLSEAEILDRVTEAAELLELIPLLKQPVETLSGGEQQRVAFGRAIVRRAPVWLLDEPFGSLDPALTEKLSGALHLLRRQFGLTIVFVTHNPNEAMSLADRVGVLGGNHLIQVGNPAEVHDRPGHRTVAFLFGQPSINLIDGSVNSGQLSVASEIVPLSAPVSAGAISLGVRPDDLFLQPDSDRQSLGKFILQSRRRWGSKWLLTVIRGKLSLRILATDTFHQVGDTVEVWMRPANAHWFATDTGWRREPEQ